MSSNLETPPLILAAGDIIRTMNREELRMLDDVIRDRYTQLNREAKRALDIGCTVEFTGKGKVTRGKVEKINPKTVGIGLDLELDRRASAHRAPRLDAHSRYALRSFARYTSSNRPSLGRGSGSAVLLCSPR